MKFIKFCENKDLIYFTKRLLVDEMSFLTKCRLLILIFRRNFYSNYFLNKNTSKE